MEPAATVPCIYQPTPTEAAENLMIFRKYMLIFLPFVHLPDSMTSDKLKEVYPIMWFNIMTVTCKNVDRRLVMSEAVKKFWAQKMVVDHDKSLDLLLGLLVILGWYVIPDSRLAQSSFVDLYNYQDALSHQEGKAHVNGPGFARKVPGLRHGPQQDCR
jgi:hypothetical protein